MCNPANKSMKGLKQPIFMTYPIPQKRLFHAVFFFGEKQPCAAPFQPNEDSPLIYIVGKLWISAF